MISVNSLSKSFGTHKALDDVSFDIEKGDVVAILGPSGSGKTTLLRCLNFLEQADSGRMTFENEEIDLSKANKKKIHEIRNKTAFVFQNFNLFLNKTSLENVTIGLTVARNISKSEADKIGREMLDKVGLSEKYDSYPDQLSGGQQQRVAIARALALKPEIIYFDEPTSALDPELINEVLNVIKDLADEKMTMLIVTHEVNFARNVSNKIFFMENGAIIEKCSTKDFFSNNSNSRISNFINNITYKGE